MNSPHVYAFPVFSAHFKLTRTSSDKLPLMARILRNEICLNKYIDREQEIFVY